MAHIVGVLWASASQGLTVKELRAAVGLCPERFEAAYEFLGQHPPLEPAVPVLGERTMEYRISDEFGMRMLMLPWPLAEIASRATTAAAVLASLLREITRQGYGHGAPRVLLVARARTSRLEHRSACTDVDEHWPAARAR